ncbi:MAG TPA: PhnD/SsuA/transferrin family substrate-binding protein, partial [Candidatus Ozemobacteraceae bacterium]|nr:PhnD/SsuA/transferrin family substrate-binding protein [Candidatus Ozemobacteraceae bacterium]
MKTRNILIPQHGKVFRHICALCLFLLSALVVIPATGETIRFGFNNTILSGVTQADAESALALWADFVAKEEGVEGESKVTGYKTVEDMLVDLRGEALDVAMLTAFEYLAIKDRVQLEVISVGVIQEQIGIPVVIAVHRTSPFQSLKDLQGKELLCKSMYVEHIGNYWLDGVLSANGLLPTSRFFSRRRTMDKVSKAVLPVFFNKADACLVRQCALDTMIELNPQLARDLRIIASSPPMLNGLCAIRPGMNATHREILIRRIPTMHQHVKGKQILTLLKLDDATSYKPEMLRAAELIYQESLKLRAGPG